MKNLLQSIIRKIFKLLRNPSQLRKRLLPPVNDFKDYLIYRIAVRPYCRILTHMSSSFDGGLLLVSGRGMNVVWAQIWTLLSLCGRVNHLKPYVLTTHAQKHLNRYYQLLDIELIYFDDLLDQETKPLPPEFIAKLNAAKSMDDYRALIVDRIPIGEIALSTHCRYHGTGLIDTTRKEVQDGVREWIDLVWKSACIANNIFAKYNIVASYHTEVFMEEYGGIYYAALNADIKAIRFTGTVRDDAYIIQHRSWEDDRLHQGSMAPSTWEKVKSLPALSRIRSELEQNFKDRYGNKWHRSKRNQPNTLILDSALARAELGIPANRKVAVVYSHILYDSIFFFGTDLFKDYATWLIETVKAAVANDKLEWYIKVHPSNIWRGEMGTVFGERYEEEYLIEKHIGVLPSHVHIVPADSYISPMTWMQLADFGVTVRGTSGLEMAALGRTVITAGTGRYEGRGFTHDPQSIEAYCDLLHSMPDIEEISPEQTELAQRYAHGVFILKPFTISTLEPRLRSGRDKVVASDDLIYIPRLPVDGELPQDLRELSAFLLDPSRVDLISDTSYLSE